jgi:serine/threonine protein kinase
MTIPYNKANLALFREQVTTWAKTSPPLAFKPEAKKLSRKKTGAPFSIIRLNYGKKRIARYYVLSNMLVDEAGMGGHIKIGFPLVVDSHSHEATIDLTVPVAIKVMAKDKRDRDDPCTQAAVDYMQDEFHLIFSTLKKIGREGKDQHKNKFYYSMPLYDGECFIDYMIRKPANNIIQWLTIMLRVAGAVERVLYAGKVHLDLKPDNMIIYEDEKHFSINLIDFDSMAIIGELTSARGTKEYVCPELEALRLGQKIPAQASMDIYSLGKIFKLIKDCELTEQRSYKSIEQGLNELIACMIKKEPTERTIRIDAVVIHLKALLAQLGAGREFPERRLPPEAMAPPPPRQKVNFPILLPPVYNWSNLYAFYQRVKLWADTTDSINFERDGRKLSRKESGAPFSIIRLCPRGEDEGLRYYALSNMQVNKPGAYGRMKAGFPLQVNYDSGKISIFFTKPTAIKIMHQDKIEPHSSARETALDYMQSKFPAEFGTLKRDERKDIDKYYYAMPLFSGQCFSDYIRREADKSSTRSWVAIMLKIALAIKSLHDMGFVHLDIKPNNMIIHPKAPYLNLNLVDFDFMTKIGELTARAGTKGYACPELAELEYDEKIPATTSMDIYSFGVLLSVIRQILKKKKSHYSTPTVKALTLIIGSMTDKDPAKRTPSIDTVLKHLTKIQLTIELQLPLDNPEVKAWASKEPLTNISFPIITKRARTPLGPRQCPNHFESPTKKRAPEHDTLAAAVAALTSSVSKASPPPFSTPPAPPGSPVGDMELHFAP